MRGLFPLIRGYDEFPHRAPRGRRKQQPVNGDRQQYPSRGNRAAPAHADKSKHRGSDIAARQCRESESLLRPLQRRGCGRKQRAECRIQHQPRCEQRMHECREYRAADQKLESEKAAPLELFQEQKRIAHVDEIGLQPKLILVFVKVRRSLSAH